MSLKHGGVFFFFASINIFAAIAASFLPETKGLSLEQMDVLFGAVTAEQRAADIARSQGLAEKAQVDHIEERAIDDDRKSVDRVAPV